LITFRAWDATFLFISRLIYGTDSAAWLSSSTLETTYPSKIRMPWFFFTFAHEIVIETKQLGGVPLSFWSNLEPLSDSTDPVLLSLLLRPDSGLGKKNLLGVPFLVWIGILLVDF